MFGLSTTVSAVILTVVLALIALAYLLFGWLRKRSWRVMLRGIGFILIPLGLLSMGLMGKVVDGINAVDTWAKTTFMSTWIAIGLVVGCIGLVAYLVGSFVPHVTGDEAASRRQAIKERKLAALQAGTRMTPAPANPVAKPSAPVIATTPSSPAPAAPSPAPLIDEKELDDILRRNNIP